MADRTANPSAPAAGPMNEPLPCPFCGKAPKVQVLGHLPENVSCSTLGCAAYSKAMLLDRWNRRALLDPPRPLFPEFSEQDAITVLNLLNTRMGGADESLRQYCIDLARRIRRTALLAVSRSVPDAAEDASRRALPVGEETDGVVPSGVIYGGVGGSLRIVADPTIPRDELQVRDSTTGRVLVRMTGLTIADAARAVPPEETSDNG